MVPVHEAEKRAGSKVRCGGTVLAAALFTPRTSSEREEALGVQPPWCPPVDPYQGRKQSVPWYTGKVHCCQREQGVSRQSDEQVVVPVSRGWNMARTSSRSHAGCQSDSSTGDEGCVLPGKREPRCRHLAKQAAAWIVSNGGLLRRACWWIGYPGVHSTALPTGGKAWHHPYQGW